MRKSFAIVVALGASIAIVCADTAVMPAQSATFTGSTRGYWFIAPVSFVMTGVKVLPQTGSSATLQNFAVLKFDGATPPPLFPTTTNAFTQMALGFNLTANVTQAVNVLVNAGDCIGVYGNMTTATSATTGQNSYGNGGIGTTIFGNAVTLNRSGMQFHLGLNTSPTGMHDVWREGTGGGNITRVEFDYQAVPEPATMAALGLGVAALLRRKRRN